MSNVLITDDEHSEIVAIQNDLYIASLSFSALSKINILQRRKFQMDSELNEDAIWMTPRNNCTGTGIIWELPMIEIPDAAAPGPHENLIVRARVICEPNMSGSPAGAQLEPELICKRLRRFVHNWRVFDKGEFVSDAKTMLDVGTEYPGLLAYEEQWRIRLTDPWYPRVNMPVLSEVDGQAVLTNDAANPDAAIYYTLDSSPPGLTEANANSKLYDAPIDIDPGASVVIRWGAYQDGYLLSAWGQATLTNNP